jgi:hypothetical protein
VLPVNGIRILFTYRIRFHSLPMPRPVKDRDPGIKNCQSKATETVGIYVAQTTDIHIHHPIHPNARIRVCVCMLAPEGEYHAFVKAIQYRNQQQQQQQPPPLLPPVNRQISK